mgnify:CR=1 FL=1
MSKKAGKWVEVLTSIKDLKPEDFPEGARLETSDLEVDLGDIDLFLGEISYLYNIQGVRYFYIYDDTFLLNKERAIKILEGLDEAIPT